MSKPSSLLGCIFDFSFNQYATTRIIKGLYVISFICSLLIPLQTLIIITVINMLPFFAPVVDKFVIFSMVLATIPISLTCVLLSRMFFELVIVVFRIAENTGKIADRHMTE